MMLRETETWLASLRRARGWSQEDLSTASGVAVRTIQRLEARKSEGSPETRKAIAAALDTDVSRLLTGTNLEQIAQLAEDLTCPFCGAALVERVFVPNPYGEGELETFECGFTRGEQRRPCPKDPEFPKLDDYEVVCEQESDGTYWSYSLGKTPRAREVSLQGGPGRTQEEALSWIASAYRFACRLPGEKDPTGSTDSFAANR